MLHLICYWNVWILVNPYLFPKWQISDSSKLKKFADDNLKFDENDWPFYMQFLLLKRLTQQTSKNKGLFRKGLKCLSEL